MMGWVPPEIPKRFDWETDAQYIDRLRTERDWLESHVATKQQALGMVIGVLNALAFVAVLWLLTKIL